MDLEKAKERILETENLTDNLEDDAANWLIDWGIAQLPALLAEGDEEAQAAKVHALMETMRQLNRVAPKAAEGSPDTPDDALKESVDKFAASYAEAFGKQIDASQVAREIAGKPPQEVMQKLVESGSTPAISTPDSAAERVQTTLDSVSQGIATDESEPLKNISAHLDSFAQSFSTQKTEPEIASETAQKNDDRSQQSAEPSGKSDSTDDQDEFYHTDL